jgi:hypothetical protein
MLDAIRYQPKHGFKSGKTLLSFRLKKYVKGPSIPVSRRLLSLAELQLLALGSTQTPRVYAFAEPE